MKRFGVVMDDQLYQDFLFCFPDHGVRTAMLRRCIKRLVKKARESGTVWGAEAEAVANQIAEEIFD